jgi:hypothetical protein
VTLDLAGIRGRPRPQARCDGCRHRRIIIAFRSPTQRMFAPVHPHRLARTDDGTESSRASYLDRATGTTNGVAPPSRRVESSAATARDRDTRGPSERNGNVRSLVRWGRFPACRGVWGAGPGKGQGRRAGRGEGGRAWCARTAGRGGGGDRPVLSAARELGGLGSLRYVHCQTHAHLSVLTTGPVSKFD